ncbi:CbtB-domain containing protein [Acrocarpospora macrocephala]|uniref:Cobalt transporter n=3 Tax=Acrocarpospora TaxID=90974 RepID=A0A5M3XVB2_9ACTN|nr:MULTISPECIES: CbtB domain-containing protein [Acrocarpospora]GES04052.1 cobalt transporter [Acrocarpospora corrugata]GES14939.1 cobalt transporter [Acrocarpospora macrocephala]GES24912.1 cobalt transporter [Acrocarpospora pleiomorpha]
MSQLSAPHVQPIPLRNLAWWALAVPVLLLVAYLVTFDQGAISQAGDYLHELMHDGRHLLGVPCH